MILKFVSIHAPVWGATDIGRTTAWYNDSFNPRSRMGSDYNDIEGMARQCVVSIHAPVWGATARKPIVLYYRDVSIHAPVWGATALKGLFFMQ